MFVGVFCRGTGSEAIFPGMASTAQGRATFIASAIKYAKDRGFQGIDLDWEYPNWEGNREWLLSRGRTICYLRQTLLLHTAQFLVWLCSLLLCVGSVVIRQRLTCDCHLLQGRKSAWISPPCCGRCTQLAKQQGCC